MSKPASTPPANTVNATDRLGFTLFVALALHVIFILGVGFTQTDANQSEALPSLEIIMANTKSPDQPDEADFLAQANQKGGGNQQDKARPSAAVSANSPVDQQGLNDRAQQQKKANKIKLERIYFINQREAERQIEHARIKDQATPQNDSQHDVEQQRKDIASLRAEIRKITSAYARRPREITLTASTREAVEAGYLAQWVNKIEHIGNLNYPAEAEVKKINGSLRLNVRINAAGQVIDVKVTRSSGQSVLDSAARRIVKLAEPFPPFPAKLKDRADQIVIVRTWDFKSNRLSTKGKS